jgi:polygalacturonase
MTAADAFKLDSPAGRLTAFALASALLAACGGAEDGAARTAGVKAAPARVASVMAAATGGASTSVQTQWGTVNEPSLPGTVCATLAATITPAANGSIDAVDANPAQSKPDMARIQAAINACPAGQAVKLTAGAGGASGFLSGPLTIKSGVTLWIDTGVTLYASRNPLDFDNGVGTCGTATSSSTVSCNPFILAKNTTGSGIVGDGTIDGRAGSVLTNGPNAGLRSWWDVAWQNKSQGLSQHNFTLVQAQGGSNLTLYRVSLVNSPNVHLAPSDITGITLWGIQILSPTLEYSVPNYACAAGTTPDVKTPATCFTPDLVKNTDGYDPNRISQMLMAYSYISTGDDNVAVGAHTSKVPLTNLSFQHNHFYYGHGMSIGSITDAGISNMVVDDLSIDGYDSGVGTGLHIKSDASRGGHIDNVTYSNVCMRNVRYPLSFDSYYGTNVGTNYPWYTNITLRNVHSLGSAKYAGGQLAFTGYESGTAKYPMTVTLDNVVLDGKPSWTAARNGSPSPQVGFVHFTFGPGAVSFASMIVPSTAGDITVTGTPGTSVARDCSTAFVPLGTVMANSPIGIPADVSANLKIVQSGLLLNRTTGLMSGTVTFTNTSTASIGGLLLLRLDALTAGVRLANATGTLSGAPTITLPVTTLAPGESVTVTTDFQNPNRSLVSYTPKLLAGKF